MTALPFLGLLASVPGCARRLFAPDRVVRPTRRRANARVIFQDDGLVLAEGFEGENSLVGA